MFYMEPTPTQGALAKTVAETLQAAGLVQRTVADETGIPLATLNRRLTGKSAFLTTELAAIAGLVGIPTSDLLARAEQRVA